MNKGKMFDTTWKESESQIKFDFIYSSCDSYHSGPRETDSKCYLLQLGIIKQRYGNAVHTAAWDTTFRLNCSCGPMKEDNSYYILSRQPKEQQTEDSLHSCRAIDPSQHALKIPHSSSDRTERRHYFQQISTTISRNEWKYCPSRWSQEFIIT